jgi:hypothetical protein
LFRIHRDGRGPWWFNSSGAMRFDLPPPNGACYLAEEDEGAFLEVFQDYLVVPRGIVAARRLSRLVVPRAMTLADCTRPAARGAGVTAQVHSSGDRAMTQAWAAAFHASGFDGIRYFVSHDPSQQSIGIALFGDAGEVGRPHPTPEPIASDLIQRIEEKLAVFVG